MITIYGKEGCPWCVKAKDFCSNKNIPHRYIDIYDLPDREFREFLGRGFKTVPAIYFDDKLIGGYEALVEYFKNDEMKGVMVGAV